jgi:hypothetical protein
MKSSLLRRAILVAIVFGLIAFVVIGLLLPAIRHARRHGHNWGRLEMTQLVLALERWRMELGNGQYPPSSADDPEAVNQFLATAFPKYHGGLPEKFKSLDAASSLVFWLGGMTDKDGNMIGFSADPEHPFDTTNESRIGPYFDFDPQRLRNEAGLPVYLPQNDNFQSDPYVYFRPDSKGEYHGAWKNCRPCRDSDTGGWINPKSYQLFSPGLDGKYGSGVQYPSGTDYDAQRKDDMSNFTAGMTLGDDMP